MALTTIQASITDGQNAITGYIQYTLQYQVTDNGTLAIPQPFNVQLVNGQATFQLEATDFSSVSYLFEVHSVDSNNNDTLYLSFYAVVPSSSSTIQFSDLATQTGVSKDIQDTSYLSIARSLYNDESFWGRLRTELFIPSGTFASTTYYKLGDVVSWVGSSYLCIAQTNIVGIYSTDATNWQLLASIGLTGTGTNGNNAPYDPVGWANQLDAPSRNA